MPVLYLVPAVILGLITVWSWLVEGYFLILVSLGCFILVGDAFIHRFLPQSRKYGWMATVIYMCFIFIGVTVLFWTVLNWGGARGVLRIDSFMHN